MQPSLPSLQQLMLFMPPPAYIGEGGNTQSGYDVCDSVCRWFGDYVRDNPRISGTVEARDFKFCVLIEGQEP